ncbi:hypothetical protein V8E55_000366 [Tylopilus felleus]
MTREIKFTSFGLPYVLEFENVSVVPSTDLRPPSPASSSSSFCYIDSPPSRPRLPSLSFLSPSSIFKRKHAPTKTAHNSTESECAKPLPPPPAPDASEAHGICIRFPAESSHPQRSRKERLVHLQKTISVAVLDAGMRRSPANANRSENNSNGHAVHASRGYRTPDALFCGTYGQLMAALEGAGLSATPCTGENLPGYTRLGALFVARNDGASGVQLRKITLWG